MPTETCSKCKCLAFYLTDELCMVCYFQATGIFPKKPLTYSGSSHKELYGKFSSEWE